MNKLSNIDLHHLYWEEGLSTYQIADRLGVDKSTVRESLKACNIPLRSKAQATELFYDKKGRKCEPRDIRKLYWEEDLSTQEIAKRYGVGNSFICQIMKRHNIPRRTKSEGVKLSYDTGKRIAPKVPSGAQSVHWKGGRIDSLGYVYVYCPGHKRASKDGKYVLEHILVWEKVHNQPLPDGWVVHHINGVKNDNRPRNLLALPKGKHHSQLVNNELKKRIRELEAEVKLLEKALDSQQLIFNVSEN